jgi:nitroreductase
MIHELLQKRFSPRTFSDKKIEHEQIVDLLEAARWAPSSMNEQPWRFLIAEKDDPQTYYKLLGSLKVNNQIWAKKASLLILTMVRIDSEITKQINKHALYDLGNSVAHLTFQAMAMGIYIRQMGGFDPDKTRAIFAVPDNFIPVSVLAIGYKGNPEFLPEDLKKKELAIRRRKDLSEIAFAGKFGTSFKEKQSYETINT